MIATATKNSFRYYIITLCLFSFSAFSFGQNSKQDKYVRYLDSALYYSTEVPMLAKQYLDSIPAPIQKNLKGRIAKYFQTKAIINGKNDEQAELYQNYLQAIKYAEIEKNYDVAGMSSLELFYNIYIVKKDSSAYKYLEDAKMYFTKTNNTNGLVEVMQMPAYVALYNAEYDKSNQLILENLNYYKSIKDDGYYYLYALFMLTSNYTDKDELDKAHTYFSKVKALSNDTTITKPLHDLHLVTLNNSFADAHFRQHNIDSMLVYIKEAGKLRYVMNKSDIRNYFGLYVDYFNVTNDINSKKAYVDSLRHFEEILLNKNFDASFQINKTLFQTEKSLKNETQKKHLNRYLIGVLLVVLFAVFMFVILRYKKIKQSINEFTKRDSEFSFLKSNHEKLKVKVKGLEDYITGVKKEMKSISSENNVLEQRSRIKELYKNLHHNSATILAKGESHLELINELNVDFFAQISDKYPQLNHSEIIICYYLFTGFKNKEIAIFLNSTVRAVESKRYRISKKLNVSDSITLTDFIDDAFKEIKKPNQ